MSRRRVGVVLAAVLAIASSGLLRAQEGARPAGLTGTVQNSGGAVVRDAVVLVRNDATGALLTTATNELGVFTLPAVPAGTYTVTARLDGLTPARLDSVVIAAGESRQITLRLGTLPADVQPAVVRSGLDASTIDRLPFVTRDALYAVTFLPGVDTSTRIAGSTLSGLPQSALGITLDGVNIQDNYRKTTDGFFAAIRPRHDAIESVAVSAAVPGADIAGEGAVRISFVTRSGTDRLGGTVYHAFRDWRLNANTFFNARDRLDRNRVTLNQFGGSLGGPLVRPGVAGGSGRAFFFVNYEELRMPAEVTRTRTVLRSSAAAGVFSYVGAGGAIQNVNLLALAAANGQVASRDPLIAGLLERLFDAPPHLRGPDSGSPGTIGQVIPNAGDPLTSRYVFPGAVYRRERQPTVRVDVNAGARHRLSGTFARISVVGDPDFAGDPAFPANPNRADAASRRTLGQATWRFLLRANLANELRVGRAWGPTEFGLNVTADDFPRGLDLRLPIVSSTTAATTSDRRETTNWHFEDTFGWQRNKHTFTFGASFTRAEVRRTGQRVVPTVSFGVDRTDPAAAMFTTANFPGASAADLANASSLYALLTGRITAIAGDARLDSATGQYTYLGASTLHVRQSEGALFAQDIWRMTPTFTVSGGLRWDVQLPPSPVSEGLALATLADICGVSGIGAGPFGRRCNLFAPGAAFGGPPAFEAFAPGANAYRIHRGNFAPSAGIVWRPNADEGFWRGVLGDPEHARFFAGYATVFSRHGLADFVEAYDANPGSTVAVRRDAALGNLFTTPAPLLLRTPGLVTAPPVCTGGQVPPACRPVAPAYPLAAIDQSVNIFDPAIKTPFTRSYAFGMQRSIGRDMTVEVRYVGTRLGNGWTTENWNEVNPVESGYFDEFLLAQANLVSNLTAGRGATFAFFGPGTNTAPLPLHLALLNGQPAASATDAAAYVGPGWTDRAMLARLSLVAPQPVEALSALWGEAAFRANAATAGLAANRFVLNPALGAAAANVTRNAVETRYDAMQVTVDRRLSRGLQVSANYTYSSRWTSRTDALRFEHYLVRADDAVPHAFRAMWTWALPVGDGRRFGAALPRWADALVGGWSWSGTSRVQSGTQLSLSGVRLVGMTEQELRRVFKIYVAADGTVTTLPADIILNTRRAFSVDPTNLATGYSALGAPAGRYLAPATTAGCIGLFPGTCGEARRIHVRGPQIVRFDFRFAKAFSLGGRRTAHVEVDALNVFNAIHFTPVFQAGAAAAINQVTSSYQDVARTFDPGGRLLQIGWRVRW